MADVNPTRRDEYKGHEWEVRAVGNSPYDAWPYVQVGQQLRSLQISGGHFTLEDAFDAGQLVCERYIDGLPAADAESTTDEHSD